MTSSDGVKADAAYHSFDVEIAMLVGQPAAVVYRNLVFWIRHNESNGKNFQNGRYWTYNSLNAFAEQFPYMTAKQLRTAIDKLVNGGLIVKEKLSENRYDRRNWYALGGPISPSGQMGLTETSDDTLDQVGTTSAQEGECIENKYKPDTKPDPSQSGPATAEEIESIWSAYPEDRRRDKDGSLKHIRVALTEITAEELIATVRVYANESADFTRSKVCFSDNWFRDRKWRRHLTDVQEQKAKDVTTAATILARTSMWIKTCDPMCRHLTNAQVEAALQAGLVDLDEVEAAGFSL